MARRIGYALLGLIAVLGSMLGFTARTRYAMPARNTAESYTEFSPSVPRRAGDATVVLFIADGFGPSIVRAAKPPNLERMAKHGAYTNDMMPVFPTLSMPNHFALSTGCYPANHGVVSNHFRDPKRGVFAHKGDADWMLGCKPLHAVAEEQGLRAAVFGHAGAASGTRGKLASIAVPYASPSPSITAQADNVIAQLALPRDQRARLITAYVTEPDEAGHKYGPGAPETIAAALAVDAEIGRVMDAMTATAENMVLIVTSDHGMVPAKRFVSVERLLRKAGIDATVLAEGSLAHIYLDRPSDKPATMAALSENTFVDVIDPLHAPPHLHIGGASQSRYGDVLVSLHAGDWTADSAFFPWYLRWLNWVGQGVSPSTRFAGMHGYDPTVVPDVRAIFYAKGTRIVPQEIKGMRTVDVHPTLALLLGIEPGAAVDGSARKEITWGRDEYPPPAYE